MHTYLIVAKLPKSPARFIRMFKENVLSICLEHGEDCVIDYISGRFILFSSEKLCEEVKKLNGVLNCYPVKIFENSEELLGYIIPQIKNCRSFAVRSNRLHIAQEIGGEIHERTGIKVNLEKPDCEICVEFRGNFFFLLPF